MCYLTFILAERIIEKKISFKDDNLMIFKNNQEVSQNFDGELQFTAISVPCCTSSAEKKKFEVLIFIFGILKHRPARLLN